MVGDPNARRDKALESIAGELAKTNKLLDKIERNTRRTRFTNHPPYSEGVGSGTADEPTGPYGSGVPFGS